MFINITKLLVILSTALTLTACGGGVQEGAAHALAASAAAPVQMAAAAPATATAAVAAATAAPQAANSSDAAARTLLWEQSISLEMNRQHEEQLERARNQASQPDTI